MIHFNRGQLSSRYIAAALCSTMSLNALLPGCALQTENQSPTQEAPTQEAGTPADTSASEAISSLKSALKSDKNGRVYESKYERLAWQLLRKEAKDAKHFHGLFSQIYGAGYDQAKAESLRTRMAAGDFSWAPPVVIVDAKVLGGQQGAYAASTGTVYLSDQVPTQFARAFIYLEEVGHHIDTLVNTADAPGDEGALFRILFTQQAIDPEIMAKIRVDNHTGTIVIDGQSIDVEYLWGWDFIVSVVSGAYNGIKSGAQWIWNGATTAGSAIKTAASKAWDGATTLSNWIARGAEWAANSFVDLLNREFWATYQTVNGAVNVLIAAGYGSLDGLKVMQQGLVEITNGHFVDGTAALFTGLAKLAVEMPVDTLVTGVMDAIGALQTALFLEPVGRYLTQSETDLLGWVFGYQWWLPYIRIKQGFAGLFSAISSAPFTNQFTIYLKDSTYTNELVVHESTHVWQWANGGGDYKLNSVYYRATLGDANYYWEADVNRGVRWEQMRAEQQASFVEDAYHNHCYDGPNWTATGWASCTINGVYRLPFFVTVDNNIWAGFGAP